MNKTLLSALLVLLFFISCTKDSPRADYFTFSIGDQHYSIDSITGSLTVENGLSSFVFEGGSQRRYITVRGNSFTDSSFIHQYSDSLMPSPTAYIFFGFNDLVYTDANYGSNITVNSGQFYFNIEEKTDTYIKGSFKGKLISYTSVQPEISNGSVEVANGKFRIPYH